MGEKFNNKKILLSLTALAITTTFISCGTDPNFKQIASNENNNIYEDFNSTEDSSNMLSESDKFLKSAFAKDVDKHLVLVNKNTELPIDYANDDLKVADVLLYCPKGSDRSKMRIVAADALKEMFIAAKKDNVELALVSAYRSRNYQKEIYETSLRNKGASYTNRYIAKPGHSEHETGLTADISCREVNFTLEENFKDSSAGKWLAENAHKYGFILRYPKDRVEDTGYSFEPWHFRYVGKEMSSYIFENNLILEDVHKQKSTLELN